jgi:hypothetical protein
MRMERCDILRLLSEDAGAWRAGVAHALEIAFLVAGVGSDVALIPRSRFLCSLSAARSFNEAISIDEF